MELVQLSWKLRERFLKEDAGRRIEEAIADDERDIASILAEAHQKLVLTLCHNTELPPQDLTLKFFFIDG
jgi:hypothetical protein